MKHNIIFGKNSEKGYWQECNQCQERKYVRMATYLDPDGAGWSLTCPGNSSEGK